MGPSPEQLRKWFGPLPGRREARALSSMALAAGIILCGISIFRGFHGQTFLGRPLGGDFVQFYVIGKILNNFAAPRIYDLELAVNLQHAVLPSMPVTQMLVFAHAPYVAALFRPFAILSYEWAYLVWLLFSALLYSASLWLIFRSTGLSPPDRLTAFLLALSWAPFLFETWIGGQLSVLAFCAWALFFYCRHRNAMFLAGFALALAVFKPTLIALPVAMLICGRRWRTFAGFAAGATALTALSIRIVGLQGCSAWINTMLFNGRTALGSGATARYAKNVDINSFFHLLTGHAWAVTAVASAVIGILGIGMLATAWSRSRTWNRTTPSEDFLWASTLCLGLVLNPYSPIYDGVVVVAATALMARAVCESRADQESFAAWLTLLYIVPCITQSFAELLHLQLFTPLLAGVGFWALRLAYRAALVGAYQPPSEQTSKLLSLQRVTAITQ